MIRYLIAFVAGCAFAGSSVFAFAQSAEPSPQLDAVVKIHAAYGGGADMGSGVVIAVDGDRVFVMTNQHVVQDAINASGRIMAYPPRHPPITLDQVVAIGDKDNGEDLALLSGTATNPPEPMQVAEREPQPGEPIYFAGYPGGGPMSIRNAQTMDSRSFIGQNYVAEFNQPAAQGMSGGPVYSADGRVAGIVFATDKTECMAVKVGPIRRLLARAFPRLAAAIRRNVTPTQCPGGVCQVPVYTQPPIPTRPIQSPPVSQPQLPSRSVTPSRPVMPDLSNYVTRDDLAEYAKRSELETVVSSEQFGRELDGMVMGFKNELSHYVKSDQLSGYARSEQVDTAIATLQSRMANHVDDRVTTVVGDAASKLSWVEAAGRIATDFGLSTLIPGGGFALIGLKLAGLVLSHRRKTRTKPAGGPEDPFDSPGPVAPPPPSPPPTLPNATVSQSPPITPAPNPDPEIIRVPTVNREAEALKEAMNREVRSFPSHAAIIERLRSSAKQLNHGRDVNESGRGDASQPRPAVGWSD